MSVRVVARIRPLLKQELDKDTIVTAESPDGDNVADPTIVRIPNPKNEGESFSFQFNSVYEQESTQQHLFDKEVSPTVKHLFNGYDTCVFAYGVTGTGKTHTMRGGKSLADRGVIPRLLSAIYRRCRKIEKETSGTTQVDVSMSYYEIYCDRVYDLFEPPEKRTPSGLPIRDNGGKTVVVGLTEKPCSTLKEFEQLYDQANINRSTSSTKLNAHSSRSHAILCVKITQTTETTVQVSRASAIDLAGSEDNRRTDNNKERLVESSAINKSLFVLAQCVEAINKKQNRIPYRESKMTRILSLGQNNGHTLMILNLAPVRSYHLDTLSSLNIANRTKKIKVEEVENESVFRHPVKPLAATSSIGGANITRQPLRPLNAAHNANLQDRDTERKKPGDKPVKAFSVYSDSRKSGSHNANVPSQNTGIRGTTAHKRAAEPGTFGSRPSKAFRSGEINSRPREPALSTASIEALISQRIDEKLAEKALQDNKRLDDIQNRIDAIQDPEKAQGAQFILMAKQHRAHGEDASALRMYQMALPYYPGNEKLKTKIRVLEEQIRAKREADITKHVSAPLPSIKAEAPSTLLAPHASNLMVPLRANKKPSIAKTTISEELVAKHEFLTKKAIKEEPEDEDFAPAPESDHDESYASDDSFRYKPKAARKPKKTTKKLPIFRDASDVTDFPAFTSMPGEQTPRTSHLLKIINSRDVNQIKGLKGVGIKKADAIVSCLVEMEAEEVRDLESLALLKGVGGRTVANMRMGLGVEVGF